jgi:hypothetical protein
MIALLLACVHAPPALYPEPLPRLELPAERPVVVEPGGCDALAVRPGWVADCTGVAISLADSDYVRLLEADLTLARVYLRETQDAAALDRQHAEREWALAWERARVAEREERWLRAAFPAGVAVGALFAIGVLWAGDEVRR